MSAIQQTSASPWGVYDDSPCVVKLDRKFEWISFRLIDPCVVAAPVAAIHVFASGTKDVDGRHKAGYDKFDLNGVRSKPRLSGTARARSAGPPV